MSSPEMHAAALKTVHTFSALIKTPLVLRTGAVPRTEGFTITVPFASKDFYLLMERQLAHLLFRSDPKAKELFIDEFKRKTMDVAHREKLKAEYFKNIEAVLGQVVDVLESRRIESLWRLLYPGSHELGRRRLKKQTEQYVGYAHLNFFDMLVSLDAGHVIPMGENDRFRPFFLQALEKVERRGFGATLIAARFMISQIVDEILKVSEPGDLAMPQTSALKLPGRTARDRLNSISHMLNCFGHLGPDAATHYSDYGPAPQDGEKSFFRNRISDIDSALKLDLRDSDAIEKALQRSAEQMGEILEEAQRTLGQTLSKEEATRKRFRASIVFKNVTRSDFKSQGVQGLNVHDQTIVRRLRALFFRAHNRFRNEFVEVGTEVDVARYIERRLTGSDIPVFRQQEKGRGFKSLLLLDRSVSMRGERTAQARRAMLILNKALEIPEVDLRLWGFQGPEDGEVLLTRFARDVPSFEPPKLPVGGDTPLHIAIEVAVRELEGGSEVKHLLVITDGAPHFAEQEGRSLSSKRLFDAVRRAVRLGRSRGVHITTLLIGSCPGGGKGQICFDVGEEAVRYMFGADEFWRFVDESTFGDDIVEVVSSSFQRYLRTR